MLNETQETQRRKPKPTPNGARKLGVLLFEFSRFWPTGYERGCDFVNELDAFLAVHNFLPAVGSAV